MSFLQTAIRREVRYLAIGLALFALIWVVLPRVLDAADSRWARDLRGETPFHDVVVLQTVATEYTLTVSGYFVKDRDCTAIGNPDILIDTGDLLLEQGYFDGSQQPRGTPNSRSASPMARRFSEWVFVSPMPWPKAATMMRTHLCSDNRNPQTNRVLTVLWATSNERQVQ